MRVDVAKLKGRAVEKGLTGEQVSKMLGIDQSTYYRKLKTEGESFTVGQVFAIAEALELSREDAVEIFFSH